MYVTTPIYYATERPHVGHAFTTLIADVLARAAVRFGAAGSALVRADLDAPTPTLTHPGDVFFLTGTDEHGTKVATKAAEAGQEPKAFVDAVAAQYRATWALLGIEPSAFIQTTNPHHEAYTQQVAQRMFDSGDIYLGSFTGLYCAGCESYKTKNDLNEAGQCPQHLVAPREITEENYFFRLSKYADAVRAHLEAHPEFLQPENRRSEVLAFLKQGEVRDISVSRQKSAVAWGVGLPFDLEHTMYVWIDALFNYVSALEMLGVRERFWPADLHLMAKEITRFHAVYWPAMLLSAGLPLPRQILAHGWFTVDGQKMSKTIGNTLYVEDLVPQFGVDATRYLLATSMRFDSDGDISLELWRRRYTAELANGFGNLVNRVVTLAGKYLAGAPWADPDPAVLAELDAHAAASRAAYASYDVLAAADHAFRVVDRANKLADERKVWAQAKEDPAAFATTIATLARAIELAAGLLHPLMPGACERALAAVATREQVILFPRLA